MVRRDRTEAGRTTCRARCKTAKSKTDGSLLKEGNNSTKGLFICSDKPSLLLSGSLLKEGNNDNNIKGIISLCCEKPSLLLAVSRSVAPVPVLGLRYDRHLQMTEDDEASDMTHKAQRAAWCGSHRVSSDVRTDPARPSAATCVRASTDRAPVGSGWKGLQLL